MTIVFSMAGLSQRFIDAGFTLPKYMLYVGNRSLFNLSVSSFSDYFENSDFLFIARDLFDTSLFIEKECNLLGLKNFKIILLESHTRGQAETVYLGLKMADLPCEEPITIFNIDTFQSNFKFPSKIKNWDGYLEVFFGEGKNWSYAKTETKDSTRVVETAEKKQISNYCSTGLYYFRNASLFFDAYENYFKFNDSTELYIAPIYNYLIHQCKEIHINIVEKDNIEICGVPDEYYQNLYNFTHK